MGWIGLHTSPNVNPHATICYWRTALFSVDIEMSIRHLAEDRRELGWRGTYPFIVNGLDTYGAKDDPKQVAKIVPAFGHQRAVELLLERFREFHQSEWPVSMDTLHVTDHKDRVFFEFKWIGFHTRERVTYERLTP